MSGVLEWDHVAEIGDEFGAVMREASGKFLELAALAPGKVVVDLACGAGDVIRQVAPLVRGNGGQVFGVDASQRMLEHAQWKASGLDNVAFYPSYAENLAMTPDTVDVVLCRFALPLFADPKTAVARAVTGLKPGGRFAVMGIGGVEHNEFFTILGGMLGAPLEQSLALGKPAALAGLLADGGLTNIKTRAVRALITVVDPQGYWNAIRALFGIAYPTLPPQLAPYITQGRRLSVELVFALGTKHDPRVKVRAPVRRFDDVVAAARRRIRELTPHEAKRKLRGESVVYIDVRHPDAREAWIKGALNIPRGELELHAPRLVPDPKTMLLVYCDRGTTSALAARQLQDLGYINVWNLYGGLSGWAADGMPVERA